MRVLLLLLVLALPAGAQTVGHYTSGGKIITYDWYHAVGVKRAPMLVVLHGSGGYWGEMAWIQAYGAAFAKRGYHVFALHYFDRTGHLYVSDRETMAANFRPWMETVRDAVTMASRKPEVDPRRVAIVAMSLGSYVGLAAASVDPRIKAVVEFFGGFPEPLIGTLRHMPPVLVLHGGADGIVPVTEAYKLMGLLASLKTPYESQIYPGQGHGFDATVAVDAERRVVAFLEHWLRGSIAGRLPQVLTR